MCCCLKILLKKTYHKLDFDVTLREFFSSLTPLIINNIVDIDDSDNKILEYKCVDLEQLPFGYNEENNVKVLSDVNSNVKNDLNFFSQLELNFMENTNIVNEMLVNWGEISLPSESLNNEFGTLSIFNEISNMSPSFSIENQDTETLSDEIASQLTEEHSNQTFPLREQTNLKPDQCSASLHAFINADADQLHINSNKSVLLGHQDSLPLSFSSTALNNNIKPESLLRAPNKEVIEKPDDEPEQMNLLTIENLNTSEICSLFIESEDKVIKKSSDEIIEISDDDEPSFNVNLSTSSNSGFEKSCDDSVIEISDTEQSLNDNLSTPVNFEKNPDKHITNSLLRVPNNELYDNSSSELIIEIPDDETSFTVNSTETNFNMNTSQKEVESFLGKQNDEEVYENCHDNMIILNPDDIPTVDPNISSVVNIDIDPDENEESFLRIPNEEIYEKCLDDMIILNPDDIPTLNVNLSTAVNVNINPDKNEVVSLLVVRNEEVYENSCEDSLLVLNDNVPSLNFTSSTSDNINADNNVTEALLIMPVKEVLKKSYENPMHVVVNDISPVNVKSNIDFNINTDKNEVPSLLTVQNEEVYKKSFDDSLIVFPDNFSPINANSTRAVSLIKNPNSNEIESMSRVPCEGKHEKCDDSTLAVIENLSFIEGPSLIDDGPSLIDDGPSLIDDGPSLIDNEPSINKGPSLVDERPSVVNYSTDVCFNNIEVVSLLPILNENVNKPYDKSTIVSPDNVLSFNDDSSTAVNLIISPYNHEHPYDVLSSDLNSTINSDKYKVESLLRVPSEDMYKECDKTKSFISGDEQCLNDDSSRSISLNIVPDKNEDKSSISDVHDDSTIGISNNLLSLNVNPSALHNLNINPDKRKTKSLLRVPNEEGYDKVDYISSLQILENEPVNPSSIVNYNVNPDDIPTLNVNHSTAVNVNINPDKNKIVSVLRAPNGEVYETSCGDSIISIPDNESPLTVSSPRAINLTINSDKHNIESLLSISDEEVSEKSSGISTNISCPIMNETSNAFDDNYFLTPGDSFWLQDSSEKVLDLSIKKRISHDANVLPLSDNPENTFIHGSNEGEHFHDEVFVITSKPLFEISNKIRIKAKPFSSNKEMPSDSTNSSLGVVIHETPTFKEAVATSNTTNGNVEDGVLNEEKQINNLSLFAEKMLDSKKDFVEKSIRQVKKPHPTELDNTQPFKRFKNDTSVLPSPTPPDSVSTLDTSITKAPNHLSSEDKAHFPCFRLRLDNDGNATLECHCVLCVLACSSQNGQNKLSTGKNNTTGSDEDHNVLVRLPIKKRKLNMDAKYNQSSIQNIVSLLANPCSSQANLSYYPTAPMVSIASMDNLLKNVSGLLWFKNAVPQNSGGPENTPSEPSTLTVLNATSYKPDTFSHNDHSYKMPNKSHMNSSNSNISNNISDTNVDSEGPQLSNIKNAHNPFLKSFINPKDIFLDKSSVPSSVFPSGTEQTIFGRSQSVSITGDSSNGFPYAQYAHNNYENRNLVADKPAKSRRPRQINRSSVIQNSVNTPYNVASSPRKRQIRTPRRSNRNTVIQNTLSPPFNAVSSLENHEASTPWSSNRGTVIKNPTHEPYMASQFQLSQASLPRSEIPQSMFTMPYNNGYYFPQYFNFLNR